MKDMEWKEEYLIGIPAIDLQHKRIFDRILGISAALSVDDKLRIEDEVLRLLNRLQEHFSLEENMMRTFNYPELEHHLEEHRVLHADIRDLARESIRNMRDLSHEALKIAHRWIEEHITVTDRHYAHFLADATVKRRRKKGVRRNRPLAG